MTVATVQERFRLIAIWSWGLMAFCLPFSTALTLIFSAFGVLFGLVGFDWASLKIVIRHPIAILCVALFAWLALSMLWSIAPRDEMIEGISKYRKLLYVPLVAMLLVSTRVKPWFLMNFFVAGCLVVCIGSLSTTFGLTGYFFQPIGGDLYRGWAFGGSPEKAWFFVGPPNNPTFGRAYIAQGAFLIFSAVYCFGCFVRQGLGVSDRKMVEDRKAWVYATLCGLCIYVNFNLGGLTGYILLATGYSIWVLYFWLTRHYKLATLVALCATLSALVAFTFNASVEQRIYKSVAGLNDYTKSGSQSSESQRIHFWVAGLTQGLNAPVKGHGVGAYAEIFSRDTSRPLELKKERAQPHSELILQFTQGGAVSLAIFLGLAFCPLLLILDKRLRYPRTNYSDSIYFGCVANYALFFVDGIINSVIWDAGEGHAMIILISTILVFKSNGGENS